MRRRASAGALVIVIIASGCIASGPLPAPSSTTRSASPAPASSTTASPSAAVTAAWSPVAFNPSTAHWTELTDPHAGPAGGDLIGFEDGYVTIGTRDPFEEPVAWFSRDGARWTAASLANPVQNCPDWGPPGNEMVPDADAGAVATNGSQVVVVGAFQPHDAAQCADSGEYHPIAWMSDDGRTWRRSESFDGGAVNGRVSAVWAVAGGWQAVVDRSLWQSADGLHWRSVPTFPNAGVDNVHAGSAPDGTAVVSSVVGSAGDSQYRLFASHDGRTWSAIDDAAGCETDATQIVAPGPSSGPAWVILADTRVCASIDLIHWTSTNLPIVVWRMAGTRFGVMAIGDTCVGAGNSCQDSGKQAYLSSDGVTWSRLEHPNALSGTSLADGPAGVVMIGAGPDDTAGSHAWLLEP